MLLFFEILAIVVISYVVFCLVRYAVSKYKNYCFNAKIKNIGDIIYYDNIPMCLGFNYQLSGAKIYFEFQKGKLSHIDLRTRDKASMWFVRQREDSSRFTAYCYAKDGEGMNWDTFYTLYGFPTTVTAWIEWLNKSIPNLKLPSEQFVTV